jgi:hypothetical protein
MDRLAGRQTRAPGPFWADGFRAHRLIYGATFLTLQTISGDVRNPRDGSESVLDTRGVRRPPTGPGPTSDRCITPPLPALRRCVCNQRNTPHPDSAFRVWNCIQDIPECIYDSDSSKQP